MCIKLMLIDLLSEMIIIANKNEKKVVKKKTTNNIQKKVYSLEELADLFGVSYQKMSSLYASRGIEKEEELSYEEAFDKFKNLA